MRGDYRLDSKGVDLPRLVDKIAIVQDETYPVSAHQAPLDVLKIRKRETGFARHTFLGANPFLLSMFKQFNELLGLRVGDYMSGSVSGIDDAIANVVQQARHDTARLTLSPLDVRNGRLRVRVRVENLTGHRFPSGVGFRRAILKLEVLAREHGFDVPIFVSGATNPVGVIVDGNGRPLPSEFFDDRHTGGRRQAYQPHYEKITRDDQVQIYEELVRDANERFTTSFVRRDSIPKDNRLLPKGWSPSGPGPQMPFEFLEATMPEGNAADDRDFTDGTGSDVVTYEVRIPRGVNLSKLSVRATLSYQAIPPSYLEARFRTAPNGPATRRLMYLTSRLRTLGTAIEGWKLPIATASSR
jgi:hypothetical protein